MKNSSPYAKDKLVHKTCANLLGNLRHHHYATVDREANLFTFDLLFTFFCFILFQGQSLKHSLSGWEGLHESCSLLKIMLKILFICTIEMLNSIGRRTCYPYLWTSQTVKAHSITGFILMTNYAHFSCFWNRAATWSLMTCPAQPHPQKEKSSLSALIILWPNQLWWPHLVLR